MRSNPAGDWRIEDVVAVCREHGLRCSPPSSCGSHYKVSHPASRDILTIPSRRPVKPVYISKLVRLIEAVTNTENDRTAKASLAGDDRTAPSPLSSGLYSSSP